MVTKDGKKSKTKERCDKGDLVQFSKGGILTEILLKLGHLPYAFYETNNSAKGHSKKKDHGQWIFCLTLNCQLHGPKARSPLHTTIFSMCQGSSQSVLLEWMYAWKRVWNIEDLFWYSELKPGYQLEWENKVSWVLIYNCFFSYYSCFKNICRKKYL